MNAEIYYVENADKQVLHNVTNHLHKWKGDAKKYASYQKIENLVLNRVKDIDFAKYKTATFFTTGIPYGLVLNNPIPFCYVNKNWREDLFIVNNIIYSE